MMTVPVLLKFYNKHHSITNMIQTSYFYNVNLVYHGTFYNECFVVFK